MSYKIEEIKPNSAKAVWNIAYVCAATDGSISREEHVGIVNTFKMTAALISSEAKLATASGQDPIETEKEAFDRNTEFFEMWLQGGITSIDDDFVKYSMSLLTDDVWRSFAVAVALFSCSMDGLDDNENAMIAKLVTEWNVNKEDIEFWLQNIITVAKTGTL